MSVPRLVETPSPQPIASQSGAFETELVELKNLLQQTLEESKSRLQALQNSQERDVGTGGYIQEDIRREASDIAQVVAEQKAYRRETTSGKGNAGGYIPQGLLGLGSTACKCKICCQNCRPSSMKIISLILSRFTTPSKARWVFFSHSNLDDDHLSIDHRDLQRRRQSELLRCIKNIGNDK